MLLLQEPIPSTPLNGSLRNFNTWRVWVGNRTLQRIFFGYWVTGLEKIRGPKTIYHNSIATFRVNFSGKEHDIDNWETVLELQRVPYSVQKFHELWSTND